MTNFVLLFVVALLVNAVLTFRSSDLWKKWFDKVRSAKEEDPSSNKKEWWNLVFRYLAVYLLAAMADWLQGPYVYALYHAYGYSQHEIAVLFIAGFGSSAVFGSFIGGMADWGGRRTFVIVYALVYALSCFTKRTFLSYVSLVPDSLSSGCSGRL
jgi:predicted MFS family arabinose efflux permease